MIVSDAVVAISYYGVRFLFPLKWNLGGEIMVYDDTDVLKEIGVGEIYTEKQLGIFFMNNPDVLILSKSSKDLCGSIKQEPVKVLEKIEAYTHEKINGHYYVQNNKKTVYVVE